MDLEQRCCAVIPSGRCHSSALGTSKHCQTHNAQAVSLYRKYKKYSKRLDALDIEDLLMFGDLRSLLKTYFLLDLVYRLRLEHRLYAFSSDCYDDGHNYQFDKLKKNMIKFEERIGTLIAAGDFESDNSSQSEDTSEESIITMPSHQKADFISEMKLLTSQRETDVDNMINMYIKERHEHDDQKKLIIQNIRRFIANLFPLDVLSQRMEYMYFRAFYNLIMNLKEIGYLDRNYQYSKRHNGMGIVIFDLKKIHLCGDMAPNFLEEVYMNTELVYLKDYYRCLLLDRDRYSPLMDDFIEYTYQQKVEAFYLNYYLRWDLFDKRLYLIAQNHMKYKRSDLLAIKRLPDRSKKKKWDDYNNTY